MIKQYSSGSNIGEHVCSCHYEDNGCADEEIFLNKCNCDANLPVPLQDTGFQFWKIQILGRKMHFIVGESWCLVWV